MLMLYILNTDTNAESNIDDILGIGLLKNKKNILIEDNLSRRYSAGKQRINYGNLSNNRLVLDSESTHKNLYN